MKYQSLFDKLRETSWQRKLTPAEQTQLEEWFAEHPNAREEWSSEQDLNVALEKLRSVPVPSNFTARVLEAAAREARQDERRVGEKRGWFGRLWTRSLMPRMALALVVFGAGLFAYHEIHQRQLAEIRQSLITISDVPSLANPEILQDFDAIEVMSQSPKADEDLIKLLQ